MPLIDIATDSMQLKGVDKSIYLSLRYGGHISAALWIAWCQLLPRFLDKPRQQRFSRPGKVRRASVPSSFQHVIFPGVASQTNQAGTSTLKPGTAPPPCMYAHPHTGLASLHWGVPPGGFSRPVDGRTGREPPLQPEGRT